MRKNKYAAIAATVAALLLITGCGSGGGSGKAESVNPQGDIKPREISWLLSRPADGGSHQGHEANF